MPCEKDTNKNRCFICVQDGMLHELIFSSKHCVTFFHTIRDIYLNSDLMRKLTKITELRSCKCPLKLQLKPIPHS